MDGHKTVWMPASISPGARIGIAAPSGAVDREQFEKGVAMLANMGFAPMVLSDVFLRHRCLAGPDHRRAAALNRCFEDDGIDAVFCARGGYGALRVLPWLDLELIQQHPKPFIGFSDISALHWVLFKECGLATYHGPVVASLANADPATLEAMTAALCSCRMIRLKGLMALKGGEATGPVAGGNLSTLAHLLGTPFSPQFRGCILLLEDINEPIYKIDRMLSQMKLAGCLSGLIGLALGSFADCGPQESLLEVVAEIFEDQDIPIVVGFEVGHGPINRTALLGAEAELSSANMTLTWRRRGCLDL